MTSLNNRKKQSFMQMGDSRGKNTTQLNKQLDLNKKNIDFTETSRRIQVQAISVRPNQSDL